MLLLTIALACTTPDTGGTPGDGGSATADGGGAPSDGGGLPDGLNGTAPDDAIGVPEFVATNRDATGRSRQDVLGHPTVMWFYPAAGTGG